MNGMKKVYALTLPLALPSRYEQDITETFDSLESLFPIFQEDAEYRKTYRSFFEKVRGLFALDALISFSKVRVSLPGQPQGKRLAIWVYPVRPELGVAFPMGTDQNGRYVWVPREKGLIPPEHLADVLMPEERYFVEDPSSVDRYTMGVPVEPPAVETEVEGEEEDKDDWDGPVAELAEFEGLPLEVPQTIHRVKIMMHPAYRGSEHGTKQEIDAIFTPLLDTLFGKGGYVMEYPPGVDDTDKEQG